MMMTRRKLEEIRVEAERRATERAEFVAHRDDCIAYRKTTERRFDKIDGTLEVAEEARNEQHKSNVARLRWQLGMSLTILLAIIGYIAEQAWGRIFH